MFNYVVQNKIFDLFVVEYFDELIGVCYLLSNDFGVVLVFVWCLCCSDVMFYDMCGELKYGFFYFEYSQCSVFLVDICQWFWWVCQDGLIVVLLWINSVSDCYQLVLLLGDGECYWNGNLVLVILLQVCL